MKDQIIKKKFQGGFESLDLNKRAALWFTLLFLIRRLLLGISAVQLASFPAFQIMLNVFLCSLMMTFIG